MYSVAANETAAVTKTGDACRPQVEPHRPDHDRYRVCTPAASRRLARPALPCPWCALTAKPPAGAAAPCRRSERWPRPRACSRRGSRARPRTRRHLWTAAESRAGRFRRFDDRVQIHSVQDRVEVDPRDRGVEVSTSDNGVDVELGSQEIDVDVPSHELGQVHRSHRRVDHWRHDPADKFLSQALHFRAHEHTTPAIAETARSGTRPNTTPTLPPTTTAALLRTGLARAAASPTTAAPAPITTSATCAVSPRR